jgi:hypothetical protein
MPFGKKKTDQTAGKSEKGERVDAGSEPKPGDIKLVDGVEYIYAQNRRYNSVSGEPQYVWYRKDQYSPGLFDTVKGSVSSTDKKERAELEKRLAKLESDQKTKGVGQGQSTQVIYTTQPGVFSGTPILSGNLAPSFSYPSPKMKRRIVVLPLSDQSNYKDEHLNELATKKLISRLENTGTIICVEPLSVGVKEDLLGGSQGMTDLNELYGIQAVVKGSLSDIYSTTSRADGRDEREISMAVSKVSLDVYDTETGKLLRQLNARNPFSLSRERGDMSPEKAKVRAIELAIELLADDLLKTLLTLDWHTRVASVDNDRIYLNAGRLSGLEKGDVLEIYAPGDQIIDKSTSLPLGRIKGNYKGEVEVMEVFGIDASWGRAKKTASYTPTDLVYLKK